MAQHSTRLQNLTHADIIRIGANFENELRNELKAAADQETERKVEFDTLFVRMTSYFIYSIGNRLLCCLTDEGRENVQSVQ